MEPTVSAAERLSRVLEHERVAAIAADVDTLTLIQDVKREAIAAVDSNNTAKEEIEALAKAARNNIVLMRHLVQCLRGFSLVDDDNAYGATGERVNATTAAAGQLRGRL
jgi:hypothetical protein